MERMMLHALFIFIISLPSCTPQPTMEVPQEFKAGQKIFHKVCSNCHGSDAMGKHTKAPRLIDADYLPNQFSNDEIQHTILNGTDKMPSQKNKITKLEIVKIIKYLRYSQQAADLATKEEEEEDEGEDEEENEDEEDNKDG